MKLRLDKYLADMGLGTRTQGKALIRKGCVFVNGELAEKPELKVDTELDRVVCNGKEIVYTELVYLLLNKPAGILTATEDKKQKTVMDLLDSSVRKGCFPVGRLDKETEGLLLITNDGKLSHELLSPKKHVPKTYFARVDGILTEEDISVFQRGMEVPAFGGEEPKNPRFAAFFAMPAKLTILSVDRRKNVSEAEIEVCEGKFHQVRRMCGAVGKPVLFLKRLSMGGLFLGDLPTGSYRKLTEKEVLELKTGAVHDGK